MGIILMVNFILLSIAILAVNPQAFASAAVNWDKTQYLTPEVKEKLHAKGWVPTRGINKVIFATGPFEPKKQRERNLKYAGPGFHYRFFDYDLMEESMRTISRKLETAGLGGVYEAYKLLRPRAFRADLWRQLILWDQGGIYMDAKLSLSSELDWIDFENDEQVLCGDFHYRDEFFKTYTNGFIASTQYHPLRLEVVMAAVSKIQRRLHPPDPLALTSPIHQTEVMRYTDMFPERRFYCAMILQYYETFAGARSQLHYYYLNALPLNQQHQGQKRDTFDRKILTTDKKDKDDMDTYHYMKKCIGCNDYQELHRKGQVYCDTPGPPCDEAYKPQVRKDRQLWTTALKILPFFKVEVNVTLDKNSPLIGYGYFEPGYVI